MTCQSKILTHIMSFVPRRELCRTVAPVCQLWRDIAYDPLRWRHVTIKESNLLSVVRCKLLCRTPLLQRLTVCMPPESLQRKPTKFTCRVVKMLLQCADFCPKLSMIRFVGMLSVNEQVIDTIVSRLPKVQSLSVGCCGNVNAACIGQISKLSELTKLDVSGSPWNGFTKQWRLFRDDDVSIILTSLVRREALNIYGFWCITDKLVH